MDEGVGTADDVESTEAGPAEEARHEEAATPGGRSPQALDRRFELFEAIVLAVAALLTAWAAFQANNWSGEQADFYSRASAARTDATAASTRAGQLSTIDVNTFTSWIAAIGAERGRARTAVWPRTARTRRGRAPSRTSSTSGSVRSSRRRSRPGCDASPHEPSGRARRPSSSPTTASPTVTGPPRSKRKRTPSRRRARDANDRGDQYVLMTILFASVLVLLSIGSKMDTFRARTFLFVTATLILLIAPS